MARYESGVRLGCEQRYCRRDPVTNSPWCDRHAPDPAVQARRAERERSEEWNGLVAGDEVAVRELLGRYRFRYVETTPSGLVEATLYGGRRGRRPQDKMRTVTADRVIVPSARALARQRRARAEREESEGR